MSLARALVLKTSALPLVERMVRRSFLFRPLVRRFIAGDNLADALRVSETILARGLRVSLDCLGENTKSVAEAQAAKAVYIEMLEEIDKLKIVREFSVRRGGTEPLNISIKLSQCGLDLGDELAEANYREVLEVAKRLATFVRIDMESSAYTERTLAIVGRALKQYPNTGTVLQSYLYRTPEDVETVIRWGARTRLVKGAYLEPPEVAYANKAKVDDSFVEQAKALLERGTYPAIATQDERIIRILNAFVAERKIDKSKFEYQMLYGVRRDLQESLAAEGYNVRIYIPFGSAWYPYFTRRLAERPANTFFILKALVKG